MNKYFLGFFVCASMSMPYTAMAGFKFTAPITEQPTQSEPIQGGLLPNLPSDTPIMPAAPQIQVYNHQPSVPIPMPSPIEAPIPVIVTAPEVITAPTPPVANQNIISDSKQSMPMQNAVPKSHDVAVGFGNDIPLTTALRQIVPSNYSYILDQNIDGEQFVTWNGGREWPLVLNDMVAPLGLKASIDGQIVSITAINQNNIAWNTTPEPQQPQAPVVAPVNIVPTPPLPAVSTEPEIMTLEDIEAKAVKSLPTPPQNIIMQDFQTPQTSIVPEVSEGQWRAQNGDSLRTVIESWANIEGVDLFWSSEFDYKLAGDVNISGNFEQAIETLLSGFSDAQPRPTGRLHPNLPHGPAVLVVETRQKTS